MTAMILDGRAEAVRLRAGVASHIAARKTPPGLAVIMVASHPASEVYVAGKIKACAEVGIASHVYRLGANATASELNALIDTLNDNPSVHGILLQLPLPAHLEPALFLERIHPHKDVDGLHPANLGLLISGRPRLVPCTPRGILKLIHLAVPSLNGLNAVVVGRSVLVGKPTAQLLTQAHTTVTQAHGQTRDLASITRQADILVVAAGQPGLITADHVKDGAVVIDVGINRMDDRLVGDVDFAGVAAKAQAITPVPGGVGPMTIACLLENTVIAADLQAT